MKRWIPLIISVMAMTGYAIAQRTTADQGRPGREGPWFITTSSSSGVSTTPQLCTTNAHKTTSVGVAATTTPAAQLASRRYVTICNSLQNAGNPTVKCRVDGTPPVMAAGNAGDVLGVGDCILYAIAGGVIPSCIADAAATNVTSYECL